MPFDPTPPAAGSPLSSEVLRGQLNGLAEMIAALEARVAALEGTPVLELPSQLQNLTLGTGEGGSGSVVVDCDPPPAAEAVTLYRVYNLEGWWSLRGRRCRWWWAVSRRARR